MRRHYVVKAVTDVPSQSHRNHFYPECLCTLIRQEDGRFIRVLLEKSSRLKPGDLLALEDSVITCAQA